jgi:mono/diheme cytochrome c family protein
MRRTTARAAVLTLLTLSAARAEVLPDPKVLADLIGADPLVVTVYEPHLTTDAGPVERRYLAHPFEAVAQALFGPDWQARADAVEFRALDGYVSRIAAPDFAAHAAHLAFGLADGSPFVVDNLLQHETGIALGPYYLIWENTDDPAIYSRGASIWPYQVAEIVRVDLSDAPLRPAGLPAELGEGADLADAHCLNCHNVGGYGGAKVPADLVDLARGMDAATFTAWLLDPRKIRPNATMPALASALPLEERERMAGLIHDYLLAMTGAR